MHKYDTYEQLAAETLGGLTASKSNWLNFLDTASRMYKYSFDEQIMIHAQRPDAKACASFAFWTDEQRMNRHVKRGAKGIALLDRESHRLYYVYDAADTVARNNQQSKNPEDYIWKIKTGTAADVNALLVRNTGVKSGNLQKTIIMMSDAAVRSKIAAYSSEFNMLYQKNADRVADPAMVQAFMETVTESVAVMALKRSGFDADAVITDQTFAHLGKFSAEYSALIGRCTCDIAADVIREVERAVKMQQKMERSNAHETLPRAAAAEENGGERDRVHSGRGNTDVSPELWGGRAGAGTDRQIRTDEGAVSEGTSESDLLADASAEHADRTSDGDGRTGTSADRQHRTENGSSGRNGRSSEDGRSDGVGRQDEQLQSSSGGNRAEGTDLRITNTAEGASSAVSVSLDAEKIHAAFAELSLNHSFTPSQQLYLDRLEKFAVKNRVSENLVDSAFEQNSRFRDVYGNRRNLNRSRFAGKLDEVENELESAIARHLSEPVQPLTEEEFIIYMVNVIQDDRTVRNAHQNSDHQNYVLDVHAAIDRIAAELATSDREIEGHTQSEIAAFLNVYHADAEQQKNVKQVITDNVDSNLNMLENLKKAAAEQGIPFSDKIRNGVDDESDPLVYDGSMGIEDFQTMQEHLAEQKSEIISFSIGFSEHPAFSGEKTEMSFAAGNKLLGMLDEKQHNEREIKECGWYHKTDFEIKCVMDGEELTYSGRYDLGDGEGSLIQHIKNHLDFCEKNYGKFGEETQSREEMAEGNRQFLALLNENAVLTAEDEQVISAIMANEDQWFVQNTSEEPDFLDEIDTAEIRRNLEAAGFVNGELVDPEKLNNTPFIQQVAADVQRIQEQEEEVQLTLDEAEPVKLNEELREPEQDFTITDDTLGGGGAKTKFRANTAAIETLKNIEAEGRTATSEEQEILSHYVGWGGLPQAFDENNDKWTKECAELRDLLTSEEYASAKGSVLNAHYTSPVVIEAIYDVLQNNGFKGGRILEPAMGIGNFIGKMPSGIMQKSRVDGVELDDISGRIAKQLYPSANVQITGYEKTDFADDTFDLAIGNVPFGGYSLHEKRYDKHHFLIHDHFFAKALDQVKPNGIVAFITSKGTLDKKNPDVRKYLAERAELVGAIRLPNDAFKANAGTEVTSDIIFLQKRAKPIELTPETTPEWVQLGQTEDGLPINQYFADHPEMVLGQIVQGNKLYRKTEDDTTCIPFENADLKDLLHDAAAKIHFTAASAEVQKKQTADAAGIVEIPQGLKNFSYAEIDNRLYFRSGSEMQPFKGSKADAERIKGMVKIRDVLRKLIEMQMQEGITDAEIQAQQQKLGSVYDAFTAKHGILNKKENQNAFKEDSSLPLLCSLEQMQGDKCIGKAPIFEKRTINPKIEITSVETSAEALGVSISEKAGVDMEFMQQLTGFTAEKIMDDLTGVIFANPMKPDADGKPRLETADEYLSGNIRKKLEYMQEHHANDPAYVHNIEALTVAMPKPLQASDIDIRLGATWIDPKLVQQFMYETLKTPVYFRDMNGMNLNRVKVEYSPVTAEWNIANKSLDKRNLLAETQFGTKRKNAYELIEDCLNLRDARVNDRVIRDGKEVYVINQRETELAQDKQRELQTAFKEWIFRDPARREQVVERYNVLFNSTRPREYDGSHLVFEGMNAEIQLRPHQKNAVAHALYGGNALFAHEVGAGKTFEMIAAAMEGKRLGLHSKSLICVPNHLTEQMGNDFIKLYPNANILVATAKDFTKQNRKKLFAKIATGDYDAIIIGHHQLTKLPISKERQERMLNAQIDEVIQGINELKAQNGEAFLVKQMEKSRKSLEGKLKKLIDAPVRDDVLNFEELGVDKLILDEAHLFKNLLISTKMRNVSGISTNDDVQKTFDLLLKCQYLDEITGGKGLIFATGTPVSNSISEIYSMMVYLQSDLLEETGLKHFDAWAANFAETVTESQLSPEGNGYQMKTRFAKFNNLPELMALFKECADVKTADMLNLPTPECTMTTVIAKPTEVQKDLIFNLGERAKRIRLRQVNQKEDNFPMITNDGRKIGLDQRLMNPDLPDEPQSKINLCVENVFKIWSDTAEQRSTQLIFSDLGVPQNAADKKKHGERFSVYEDIKKKLIDRGVPPEEIAFIHDAATEDAKDKLFAKVRKGEIRVLIGSTAKMGAGTNVQDKLIASHDLDAPWKPSDMEQRRGRMVRQGNENPHVQLFRYVTEGTFDAYLYQMLENKQRFISQIMTSKSPVRSCQDMDEVALSFAEIKALSAGNPMIKEKMDLDVEVAKLKMLKANHQNVQYQLEDKVLKIIPAEIAALKARMEGLEKDIASYAAQPVRTDEKGNAMFPSMEIDGKVYADKEEAGAALLDALRKTALHDTTNFFPVASYQGFEISAKFDVFRKCYVGEIKGAATRQVEFGGSEIGNITRIDNALAAMEKDLTETKTKLENAVQQLEDAKTQLGQPFPREEELAQKEARLVELTRALEITDEVRITDPFIIELKSEQQLDSLKNSSIPFEHSKTEDGRLLVKVNKSDKDAAQKAITSGSAGLKL